MKNVEIGTIIRTLCLGLALINQVLTSLGKCPLPIDDAQIAEIITMFLTIGTSVVAWWKNNSFTSQAIESDKIMRDLNNGVDLYKGVM